MPGPFTIPPAALAAAVAQNSGIAAGHVEAYKDQVAKDADLAKAMEGQRQFDAEQKRLQEEFQAKNKIDTRQDARLQSIYDTNRGDEDAIRAFRKTIVDVAAPVPVDPRVPGGATKPPTAEQQASALRRQLSGALAVGDTQTANVINNRIADLEGMPMRRAQLRGTELDNVARDFQNHIAPTLSSLDVALKRAQISSSQNDTPQARAGLEMGLAQFRDRLDRSRYEWELNLNQRYAVNPMTLTADLQKVTTAMQLSSKVLQTEAGTGVFRMAPIAKVVVYDDPGDKAKGIEPRLDPNGKPVKVSATLGQILSDAQRMIGSSNDPLLMYTQILSDPDARSSALRENPEAMTLLSEAAIQRKLLMRMQGTTPEVTAPKASAPGTGIAGLSLAPPKPKGPFQPPKPVGPFGFGGGSSAGGPFGP